MPMPGRTRALAVTRAPRPTARAARALALGLALPTLATLAGCGQPTPASPDDSVAPTVSVAVQPTITAETPDDDAADPSAEPTDGGLFDASSSLSGATCEPTGDSWSFTGTLTNSDTEEHTFTVAAFIVKVSDGSDVASKELDVKLAPGASAPVAIRNFHTGPKTGVECLNGVTVKGL
ncbi:hypothetical protein [Terrabacter terrigena]|uniref:Uncharacterized protein n=1 Tax=Terrabacter terrigena TaxID=574718 RepID=A0ABW3MUM1_9MICO